MSQNNKIPFLDLVGLHKELEEELCSVFKSAVATGGFVGGPMVEGFERDFAGFCNVQHCVGVSNGTDALRFALMAAGVKPGELVITVPNTFIATVEAITQAGGHPGFVDIEERSYNMHPALLEEYLEARCGLDSATGRLVHHQSGRPVAAIVPVHLFGQPADMDLILELAERYNLSVIEDACQAHGAEYFSEQGRRWRKTGSMGRAAAFSFYPGKNLGACGEGGAVTTDNAELAQHIRMLRDHGQAKKYYHEMEGCNGRLDAIQAGILQVKLRRLREWNEQRREAAARYRDLFEAAGMEDLAPYEPAWAKAIYHLYVIRVRERDGLIRRLAEAGIGTGIHYPIPLHMQNAYRRLGYKAGAFPESERAASEIVSLPMFPGITVEQQERVVGAVVECVQGKRAQAVAV